MFVHYLFLAFPCNFVLDPPLYFHIFPTFSFWPISTPKCEVQIKLWNSLQNYRCNMGFWVLNIPFVVCQGSHNYALFNDKTEIIHCPKSLFIIDKNPKTSETKFSVTQFQMSKFSLTQFQMSGLCSQTQSDSCYSIFKISFQVSGKYQYGVFKWIY